MVVTFTCFYWFCSLVFNIHEVSDKDVSERWQWWWVFTSDTSLPSEKKQLDTVEDIKALRQPITNCTFTNTATRSQSVAWEWMVASLYPPVMNVRVCWRSQWGNLVWCPTVLELEKLEKLLSQKCQRILGFCTFPPRTFTPVLTPVSPSLITKQKVLSSVWLVCLKWWY